MAPVDGLRVPSPRASNGGFIAACNDGAARARGDVLVFLNNDTVPQPGWLDALLETFDAHPEAGLVGAQLLYPDGRLQEAGGVVFADGSGLELRALRDRRKIRRYASLRDADYCSRRRDRDPACAVRVDSAASTRATRRPTTRTPTSPSPCVPPASACCTSPHRAWCTWKASTSGTDTSTGPKAYQVRNRGIFADKWRDALATQPAPGSTPTPALLHAGQRQVLIIDEATAATRSRFGLACAWST